MASDRRPRPRRRPLDDDYAPERPRPARQRGTYVPRQGSGRQAQGDDDYAYEERPARRSGADRERYRPQQAPYRGEPVDAYEDEAYAEYDDYEPYEDDRVIVEDRTRRGRQPAPDRSSRAARGSRAARPAEADLYDEEYDVPFDDGFIDEEDWYEEEAAAGAYRPRQRAARGGGRTMPRPNVSLPRPTMPRPTVPPAVREAALVQDRNSLLLTGGLLLSVLAMALLAMNRVDSLAPGFPTHISASGVAEEIRSETALWQLPLMAGALLLMNLVLAWFIAPHSRFSARFLLIASVLVQVVIWVALLRIAF